jgi:hypothetical protein
MPGQQIAKKKRTEIAYRARKEGNAAAVKEFGCFYVSLGLEWDKENDENCPQMDMKRSGRPRLLSDRDDRHVKRLSRQGALHPCNFNLLFLRWTSMSPPILSAPHGSVQA